MTEETMAAARKFHYYSLFVLATLALAPASRAAPQPILDVVRFASGAAFSARIGATESLDGCSISLFGAGSAAAAGKASAVSFGQVSASEGLAEFTARALPAVQKTARGN